MKILTCNVPETHLNMIAQLIGNKGIYPSRSELIRVAVREYLINELGYLQKNEELDSQEISLNLHPKTLESETKIHSISLQSQ